MPEPSPRDVLQQVLAALRAGHHAEAGALACSALQGGEVHPLFLQLRASLLEERGDIKQALSDLSAAHAMSPADPGIGTALGQLLARAGRPLEAIQAYDTVISAAPRFGPAHFHKGWSCEMIGELDAARRAYEAAAEFDPNVAEPYARMALLAVRRADFEDARRNSQSALERHPNHPTALQALARADLDTGHLSAAEAEVRDLLRHPNLSAYDRYVAMGLVGEICERRKQFAEAFEAFSTGNEAYYRENRARFGTNGTALDSLTWLIDLYQHQPPPPKSISDGYGPAVHVFLVGFPRSGTTLIEQALACHPDVQTMEEKDAFEDSVRAFMSSPQDHSRLADASTEHIEQFRAAYWRRVAEHGCSPRNKVFVDKLPFHTVKLPLIAAMFPRAKILFAIRDPRDVVIGCFRARFRVNPYMIELLRLGDAARFYAAYMTLADLYRRSLPLNILDIRHEDAVSAFENVCRRVCDFLELPWMASMNDFALRQHVRAVATPSGRQLAGGLTSAGVGRWRHYARQMEACMSILAPWVRRFGYPLDV